jgi:hypothetical protein
MAMNLMTHKTFLLILVAFSLAIMASPLIAEVYKTVDEDGNVTYTDKPPPDGSKPIKLAPISVIEAPTYEKAPDPAKAEGEEIPLRDLRKIYRDFAIVSPQSEESVWRPDGPVSVAWSVGNPLQQGMQVSIYLDGAKQATTTEQIIPIAGLDRGEHTLTAELRDAKNRRIATAVPVTFFIQQPNIYTNRPRPRGGG